MSYGFFTRRLSLALISTVTAFALMGGSAALMANAVPPGNLYSDKCTLVITEDPDVYADGLATQTATFTARDVYGNPVADVDVTFGTAYQYVIGKTDSNGQMTLPIISYHPGSLEVTAAWWDTGSKTNTLREVQAKANFVLAPPGNRPILSVEWSSLQVEVGETVTVNMTGERFDGVPIEQYPTFVNAQNLKDLLYYPLTDYASNPIIDGVGTISFSFDKEGQYLMSMSDLATMSELGLEPNYQGSPVVITVSKVPPPDAPVVDSASEYFISGTAQPSTWITIVDVDGTVILEAETSIYGYWGGHPAEGSQGGLIWVTATDQLGQTSDATQAYLVVLPVPLIMTYPVNGDVLELSSPYFTVVGTGLPGAMIAVLDNGGMTSGCKAIVDLLGNFKCEIKLSELVTPGVSTSVELFALHYDSQGDILDRTEPIRISVITELLVPHVSIEASTDQIHVQWNSCAPGSLVSPETVSLEILVVDQFGQPMPYQIVDVAVDDPLEILSGSSQVVTNDEGYAYVKVGTNPKGVEVGMTAKVTASVEGSTQADPASWSFKFYVAVSDWFPDMWITAEPTSGTQVFAGSGQSWTITVHMYDFCGTPFPGHEVFFDVSGSAVLSSSTAYFNNQGEATITVVDMIPETVIVRADSKNAYFDPVAVAVEFTLHGDTFPKQIISIEADSLDFSVSDDPCGVYGGWPQVSPKIVTADILVVDQFGNPVLNAIVDVEVDAPLVILSGVSQVVTNEDGHAYVQLSTDPKGSYNVREASLRAFVSRAFQAEPATWTFSIYQIAVDPYPPTIELSAQPTAGEVVVADGTQAWTISGWVWDWCHIPMGELEMFFDVSGSAVLSSQAVLSDKEGWFSVTVVDSVAEQVAVTVTSSDYSHHPETVTVEFVSDTPPEPGPYISITAEPTRGVGVQANGKQSWTITALATDRFGNRVSGVELFFGVTGSAVLSSSSATTLWNGTATITVTNSVAEQVTVSLFGQHNAFGQKTVTIDFTPHKTPELIPHVSITSNVNFFTVHPDLCGNNGGPRITPKSADLTVRVVDQFGDPMPNEILHVGWEMPLDMAIGGPPPRTDSDGYAYLNVISFIQGYRGEKQTSVKVSVAYFPEAEPGIWTFEIFQYEAELIPPVLHIDTQPAVAGGVDADGEQAWTVTAQLLHSCDIPAREMEVFFDVTGSAVLSAPSAWTNSEGVATVTVVNSIAEQVTLTVDPRSDLWPPDTVTLSFRPFPTGPMPTVTPNPTVTPSPPQTSTTPTPASTTPAPASTTPAPVSTPAPSAQPSQKGNTETPPSSQPPSVTGQGTGSSGSEFATGTTIDIGGGNWVPGETVGISVQSSFIDLGTVVAGVDGTIPNIQFLIPDGFELGSHTITATGSISGARTWSFTVVASESPALTNPMAPTGGTIAAIPDALLVILLIGLAILCVGLAVRGNNSPRGIRPW